MTPDENGPWGTASGAIVHIVLVEDNLDQRELTIEALSEAIPNARVTVAKDGPAALEAVRRVRTDVAILDYNLPGMSGLEVLREIRKESSTIPVVMVTGQGDESIAVETMKNGAQDYVIKTSNYHETLPITIERAIREGRMKRELEEASLRGRRLYELSLSVAKERKVDVLSERLVHGAATLIGAEKTILYLVDAGGALAFVKFHGIDSDETPLPASLEKVGLLSAAYSECRPVVIEQPEAHPEWGDTSWLHPLLRHMLSVPLAMQGRVEGALCVLNKTNRQPFSPEDIDTLSTLAVHAGVAIDNARFMEKIKQQAVTDSLTGLYNHMEFQRHLVREIYRSRRYNNEFSLLILDLDHFKLVNDTFGHQVGDTVLKEIANILRAHLRSVDKVFRYGGEEFAILLPQTGKEDARVMAERIRQGIADSSYDPSQDDTIRVTVSIGLSTFPHDAHERKELIGTADQALFAAKRAGRDRVAFYGEESGAPQTVRVSHDAAEHS